MKNIIGLIIFGIALFLYLFSTSGFADVVYLKGGQKITGRIITKDATGVIIETKFGSMKIKQSQIDRFEQISTEENYLKDGDTLVEKGDLEKAVVVYQQGFDLTQSPRLKDKVDKISAIIAERNKELDNKQKAEQVTLHLAEYKRLKDKFADELALRELEAANKIDPNNQTVQELLSKESFISEERNGFVEQPSKFAALATHLFDLGSTDSTLREYYSRYTIAMQRKAVEKAKFEQLAKEQEIAEQERRLLQEKELEINAPLLDMDSAFYPEATTWYMILDSPLYDYGKIPIIVVNQMRVFRADTTADIPQLIPIRGLLNIPTVGNQAKLRIKKKEGEKITLGTLELKGTMIPILLQLWDSQMLYTTKGTGQLTDMKTKELLDNRTLEYSIQWDTDTANN